MTTYKLHSLTSHVDAAAAVHIPDLMSGGDSLEFDIDREVTANEFFPSHASVTEARMSRTLEGYALASLLDLVGLSGLAITSTLNPGVLFTFQQFDTLGQAAAGSVHRTLTIKSGWLIPRTLTVDHRGHAALTVEAVAIKPAASDAVVISDVAALPTIAIAPARWTLGPASVAGYTLNQYRNFEIDFGLTVTPAGVESDIWDGHIEVRSQAPTITFTGIAPAWFSATGIPLAGKVATHANTSLVLRKRDGTGANSGFVSNATAEHIKFTAAGPATVRQAASGSAQQATEHSIVVECMKDAAGNSPMVIDTTATY